MEKIHAVINTSKCVGENIDALNACGIYADENVDNGVLVKLTKIRQDGSKNIEGFDWEVEPATERDTGLWIVKTAEVGTDLFQQYVSDPRYFYNAKGEPMSIMKLIPNCDYIEFEANAFTDKNLPDTSNGYAKVGENGKLTRASMAPEAGGYFEFVGKHTMPIGMEDVPSVILRYTEKVAQA